VDLEGKMEKPENKRILLLYADKYYLIKQVYPFGLDLIANYMIQHGYDATIQYPFLPDPDLETNLLNILDQTNPHFIGLGIRSLDTCMSCEKYGDYRGNDFNTFYFLPDVKRIVEIIKKHVPDLPIIAGGGGFTISPVAILKYLEIEYGVVGEGEEPLRQFVNVFPEMEKVCKIPNLVYFNGDYIINPRQEHHFRRDMWPFLRNNKFNYSFEKVGLPVQVKRGCNQRCSYCVEPIIEGRKFVFREIEWVIEELKNISETNDGISTIFFVDTEFNMPDLTYCSSLIKRIIEEDLQRYFSFSSQLLPKPFDSDFAKILAEAGFSIILTCDSFADDVLEKNQVSYCEEDIISTLKLCEEYGISLTISMIFGLPGESYETIDHSLKQMNMYPPNFLRRYEYTIGGRIYQGTALCRFIEKMREEKCLYGTKSEGYLEPFYFCSPDSPMRLKQYIEGALGYSVSYENYYDKTVSRGLALAFLADQGMWEEVIEKYLGSDLSVQSNIYDYLFRKMTEAERVGGARAISEKLLAAIQENDESGQYQDQTDVIKFYLNCLQ
jgi:radical SAM superfamily enzyme YgiQ (UPF0313 family)